MHPQATRRSNAPLGHDWVKFDGPRHPVPPPPLRFELLAQPLELLPDIDLPNALARATSSYFAEDHPEGIPFVPACISWPTGAADAIEFSPALDAAFDAVCHADAVDAGYASGNNIFTVAAGIGIINAQCFLT